MSIFILATKIDIMKERVVSGEEGRILMEKMGGRSRCWGRA
jgi:hypothetical protein